MRIEKQALVHEIKSFYNKDKNFICLGYKKLLPTDSYKLRRDFLGKDISFYCVKKKIFNHIINDLNGDLLLNKVKEYSLMVIFSNVENLINISRFINEKFDKNENYKLLGSLLSGNLLDVDNADKILSLLTLKESRLSIIRSLRAPGRKLIKNIKSSPQKLMRILKKIAHINRG